MECRSHALIESTHAHSLFTDKAQGLTPDLPFNGGGRDTADRAAIKVPNARGHIMNDLTLRRLILDELEFLPNIDAAAIGVTIEEGVVALTGHVRTYAEKMAAERAVKRIKGVRAVAEEIEVRVSSELALDDSAIASRCLDVIRWNTGIPDEQIRIKVQQGWVTLEGNVEWQYQKEAAFKAIQKLAGVTGLTNLLMVAPEIVSEDIKTLIEQALARNSELNADRIRISVTGDLVRLEGYVHRWLERKAVEHAAWAVAGVKTVENHVLIT
jgi:osmotically-inducible protein OsmY